LLDGGGAAIFTANPDGSDEQPVPLGDAEEDFGIPIWSPDHTRLLVTNTLRFDGNGDLRPFRPAIVNPDGTGYHVLEIPDGPFDAFCSAWNGDGTRIFCGFGGDTPGIVSVRASDGGDVRRLTTSPFGAAGGDVPADISPDGTELLFIRKRPGPAPDPQQYRPERFALYAINVNGTHLRQIVSWGLVQGHEIQGAHWSPNGKLIISSTPQGKVFTVPATGGVIKTLKLGVDGFAFEANWSPDGSRIIFGVFGPEQQDLYTANPDGSQVRRVTNTPDFENGPDWR
jgi:Tol biopolymer transport system component